MGNTLQYPVVWFSGDPKQDLAYERQYEQQTYQVIPEVIKNFIQYFHKTVSDLIDQKVYELQANRVSSDIIDQKVYEIQDIYENRSAPATGTHLVCDAPSSIPIPTAVWFPAHPTQNDPDE